MPDGLVDVDTQKDINTQQDRDKGDWDTIDANYCFKSCVIALFGAT